MQELFQQTDPVLFGMDWSQIFQIVTYLITTAIGGVGYKFYQLYLSHQEKTTDQKTEASENLIDNLEKRIKALTARVGELESKREQSYERELEVTKMLAKAEQKVENLEDKIETLERNQEVLERTIDKYYQKYGPLDEIIERSE